MQGIVKQRENRYLSPTDSLARTTSTRSSSARKMPPRYLTLKDDAYEKGDKRAGTKEVGCQD